MHPPIANIPSLNLFLSSLTDPKTPVHFRKNQVIFSHGDPSDSIFYVETGAVKLTVTSVQGKEAVIAVLGRGNLFGENALASGVRVRSYQATALSRVRAFRIESHAAMKVICKHEEACRSVLSYLIDLTERLGEDVAANILYDSGHRLARALLSLSKLKEPNPLGSAIAVNQQTLACIIGTTRQRVNILIQEFRKTGLIADTIHQRSPKAARKG